MAANGEGQSEDEPLMDAHGKGKQSPALLPYCFMLFPLVPISGFPLPLSPFRARTKKAG